MSAKEKLDKKNLTRLLLASIYLKTNKLKSKKKKKAKRVFRQRSSKSLRYRETQGELLINIKRNVLAKERKEPRSVES